MLFNYISIATEVKEALVQEKPIVALESTIISHGMPYPENLQVAQQLEAEVRAQGAVPATIGVIEGKIKIGLTAEELELLAQSEEAWKISRRDLPYAVTTKRSGGTTVAATAYAADLVGITIFATGGIGGVHRGVESMDISADLQELAKRDVAVICAGAKAILDLPRTLEYLETQGVPVIGYQTNELPAFYTRKSGIALEQRLDSPEEVAQLLKAKWSLKLSGAVLIANPIPTEAALDDTGIEQAIEQALQSAMAENISGKQLTPFLLDKVKSLSAGSSLEANIALVRNNARVAAQIAKAFAAV